MASSASSSSVAAAAAGSTAARARPTSLAQIPATQRNKLMRWLLEPAAATYLLLMAPLLHCLQRGAIDGGGAGAGAGGAAAAPAIYSCCLFLLLAAMQPPTSSSALARGKKNDAQRKTINNLEAEIVNFDKKTVRALRKRNCVLQEGAAQKKSAAVAAEEARTAYESRPT
eukprot:6207406-Pleurochrysis_carterae.AAC.1